MGKVLAWRGAIRPPLSDLEAMVGRFQRSMNAQTWRGAVLRASPAEIRAFKAGLAGGVLVAEPIGRIDRLAFRRGCALRLRLQRQLPHVVWSPNPSPFRPLGRFLRGLGLAIQRSAR